MATPENQHPFLPGDEPEVGVTPEAHVLDLERKRLGIRTEIQSEVDNLTVEEARLTEELQALEAQHAQAIEGIRTHLEVDLKKLEIDLAQLPKNIFGRAKNMDHESEIRTSLAAVQTRMARVEDEPSVQSIRKNIVRIEDQFKTNREQRDFLTRDPALFAWGGTMNAGRSRSGSWGEINLGILQSQSMLSNEKITFGTGQKWGKRLVIFRELQNPENRGGYAYNLLFDPGEELWRLYHHNGARLLKNMLASPEIKDMFTRRPDDLTEAMIQEYIEQLTAMDTERSESPEPELVERLRRSADTNAPEPAMPLPTIEQMAAAHDVLSKDEQSTMTWAVNADPGLAREFGSRSI